MMDLTPQRMMLSETKANSLLNQASNQSAQQLQAKIAILEALHEAFCLEVSLAITQLISQNAHITHRPAEIMSFNQYLATCNKPTLYYSMSLMPHDHVFLLAFSNLLIAHLINTLFGGETSKCPVSKLGQFEIRMGNRLMTAFIRALQNVWKNNKPTVTFQISNTAFNPRLIAIVPASEHIIVTQFSCSWGNTAHEFSVVYPETMLNTITTLLSSSTYHITTGEGKNWRPQLEAALVRTPVELAIMLPEINIKLYELLTLQVGDILPIEDPARTIITLDNQKIFVGKSTQHTGKHAIIIDRPL